MAEAVRRSLTVLNAALAPGAKLAATKGSAEDTAAAIADLDKADYALATALIFDRENGLLRFVRLSRGHKEHDDAQAILCTALARFMADVPDAVRSYTGEIQTLCQVAFEATKSAKCRDATFSPLAVLIDTRTRAADLEQLDIAKMFSFYFGAYKQQQTKLQASVKGAILQTLGSICRFHWKTFGESSLGAVMQLQSFLLQSIETLFHVGKEPSLAFVEGALRGLDDLMFTSVDLNNAAIFAHCKRIMEMLNPETASNMKRYAVPTAALQLFANHATNFREWLYAQARDIYGDLKGACNTKNPDVSKLGYRAMDAFLVTLVSTLHTPDGPLAGAKQLFWWFMTRFGEMMHAEAGSYKDVSLAVRSYGYFALACQGLATSEDLESIIREITKKSYTLLITDVRTSQDASVYLPSFFEAYACLVPQVKAVGKNLSTAIGDLAKNLLIRYPMMSSAYQGLSATALRKLLLALFTSGPAGRAIWSSIAYEAVLVTCTCSNPNAAMEDTQFAFEDYMNFWSQLFRPSSTSSSMEGPSIEEEFAIMLYDEVMNACLQVPRNLNLNIKEDDGDEDTAFETAIAENPIDVGVLTNFTQFMDRFLSNIYKRRFPQWIYIMGDTWIELALQNPLISSFHVLLSIVFKMSDTLNFFQDALEPATRGDREGNVQEVSPQATSQQKSAYLLFTSYMKQVALRSAVLKDDMLAGSLRLILACPADLISTSGLTEPLATALRLGLSYPSLAENALDALERWIVELPRDALTPMYQRVLPVFADYLVLDSGQPDSVEAGAVRKPRKPAIGARFDMRRLAESRNRFAMMQNMSENRAQYKTIRTRIAILLGNIGGDNRLVLGQAWNKEQVVAWDTEKRLGFDVPFKEILCKIHLDDMLPRIMELAESSPDRQTKVAATELFHACVILMIGRSAKHLTNTGRSEEVKKSPFHKLYGKVFPALLRLAIDPERVTKDLFHPLVFQIIHWLTKNSKAENPETMAMLNTCLEAISVSDGALRAFASDCVREFIVWSIKHTVKEQDRKNSMNVKSVLKRLYQLLSHANADRRLGGATAFNKIYRTLREEDAIVDQFTIEIIYNLLISLRLAEDDDSAHGTRKEGMKAINHFVKILKRKTDVFQRATKLRRKVDALQTMDMGGLISWVFAEIGRPEINYSQYMMQLFMDLSSTSTGPRDQASRKWLQARLQADDSYVRNILEKDLRDIPRDATFHSIAMKRWINCYTTCVNGYAFLMDAQLLDAGTLLCSSCVMQSIGFFIEAHATAPSNTEGTNATERLQGNERRSIAIVKTFTFLQSILTKTSEQSALDDLWSPRVFQLTAVCVFRPASVGFALESQEIKRHLPAQMVALMILLRKKLEPKWSRLMMQQLGEVYQSEYSDLAKIDWKDSRNRSALAQSISGLQQLQTAGLLERLCSETSCRITEDAYKLVLGLADARDPMTDMLVGELLTFCLKEPRLKDRVLLELLGLEKRENVELSKAFYQAYGRSLNPWLARNFKISGDLIGWNLGSPMANEILQGIPDFLLMNKLTDPKTCETFITELVRHDALVRTVADVFEVSDLLRLCTKLLRLDPTLLTRPQNPAFANALRDIYVSLLNPQSPLSVLNDVLSILPPLLGVGAETSKIEQRLREIVANQFPVNPSDLQPGSTLTEYETSMQMLITALETSNAAVLVRILIPHVCRSSTHPFAAVLTRSIKLAGAKPQFSEVRELLHTLQEYYRDSTLPASLRRNVVSQTLSPLLNVAPPTLVRDFFSGNVKDIMTLLAGTQSGKVKDQLLAKAGCFELLDLCYTRLEVKDVHAADGDVVKAYCDGTPKTGKELSMDLIKLANAAKNEATDEEPSDVVVLRRGYHQAAYNALAAVILSTQSEKLQTFCTAFLFKENPAKKEHHWTNIIDPKMDLTEALNSLLTGGAFANKRTNGQYLASQYLTESSLSQTTTMTIASSVGLSVQSQNPEDMQTMDFASAFSSPTDDYIPDMLLSHSSCMRKIVTAIKRLSANDDGTSKAKAPGWMNELFEKTSNSNSPLNVRLFLGALVLNVPQVFKPYANDWWKPIASLVADHRDYSETISPFVERLSALLLEWGSNGNSQAIVPADTKESRALIYRMIEALVKSATVSPSLAQIKRHLNIISYFVDMWPTLVVPPTNEIYQLLCSTEKRENLSGAYLTSVFIFHNLSPFDIRGLGNGVMSEYDIWKSCISLMGHPRKEVYGSAAEVVGKWVAYALRNGSPLVADVLEDLHKKLQSLNGVRGSPADQDRFVLTLASLSVGYPDIMKDYSQQLLFVLPRLAGKTRARCLYALSSYAPQIEGFFEDFRAKKLMDLIQQRDEETQRLVLITLYNISSKLSPGQIKTFLPAIIRTFTGSSSEKCRQAYYSLLQKLHEHLDKDGQLSRQVRIGLLAGSNDPNDDIRNGVLAYLSNDPNMENVDIFEKTQTLLRLYEPESESSYLSFTSSFLLGATQQSPQYSAQLFDSGLPDATFVDAHIDCSWGGGGSMQPIFAATQATIGDSLGSQRPGSEQVRATQQVAWSLTLDMNPLQARDTLSQAGSEISGAFSASVGEDASALGPARSRRKYATIADTHRHFANQADRIRRNQARSEQQQKAIRANTVVLARKYRVGDLPDIEIENKEIIDPLRSLAIRDPDIAQHVLSSIIARLYDGAENYSGMVDVDVYRDTIATSLQRILKNSIDFSTPVMAAILRTMSQMSAPVAIPSAVYRASEQSSNSHLGILLLEKCVSEAHPPASKRARTSHSTENSQQKGTWLYLARLYKSLANLDIYRAIVEHRISSDVLVKEATAAESSKLYEQALKMYTEVLAGGSELGATERDICHTGEGDCLDNLGSWDALTNYVNNSVSDDLSQLWDDEFQEPYLRLYFRAELRHQENALSTFVNSAVGNPRKRHILETRHLKDLSLLMLSQGDLNRARHYSQQALETFLSSFGGVHPLAYEARLSKLSPLQVLVEIQAFADWAQGKGSGSLDPTLLLHGWAARQPSLLKDAMPTWEDVMLNRKLITNTVASTPNLDINRAVFELALAESNQMMQKAARKQHNFFVATRYTLNLKKFDSASTYATLKLAFARLPYLQVEDQTDLASQTIGTFNYYQDNIDELNPAERARFRDLEGRMFGHVWQTCLENPVAGPLFLANKYVQRAAKATGHQKITEISTLVTFARTRCFDLLREALHLDRTIGHSLHLASHCDKVLRKVDETELESETAELDGSLYARELTINTLTAMKTGNATGIELFPRLLQLLEQFPAIAAEFETHAQLIPSWTFLRWLPQMTALLDKASATALLPVIAQVARDYPAALYFPLSISSEQYSFGSDSESRTKERSILQIKALVDAPLLQKFQSELRRLTEPLHTFKDWIARTDAMLRAEGKTASGIMAAFQEMSLYCLTTDSSTGDVGRGFASRHAAGIFKLCGKDGGKIPSMSAKNWREVQDYYRKNIDGKEALPPGGMVALKRYSPWLASFTACDHTEEIEIPGQYNGSTKPRLDQHVKIAGFHSEVLVMGSIRRPKRLIIVGSDEKLYPWLIKGGEDLRLDQRVQEMFSVMNGIMAKDPRCQDLSLRTYKVVPMSTTLGILQWVDNTKPLKEVIESIPGAKEDYARADNKHQAFVSSFTTKAAGLGDLYGNMFKQANQAKVSDHMRSLVAHEPYLRHWMHKLAASPEAFLLIRATFAKSLAALSVCSYLLGIGDRHLENFLVDMGSGQIIGIDFGHAFGSATEVLPIPELVPFRLTRQLELAMEPLGTHVLLKGAMVNTMSALRDRKEVLLNVLNIFIKEPLMEWRKFAISQAQKQGKSHSAILGSAESSLNPPEWYPQQKLDIAKRKLNGEHPSHLMAQELQWGHGHQAWFRAARDVLLGTNSGRLRSEVGVQCATVQEQIECLIDQATDPNILGRAWRGWGSWC